MQLLPDMDEMERIHGVTFGRLVDLEPQLEALLWQARQAGATCGSRADVGRTFSRLRDQLSGLIGFSSQHHRHPVLSSVGAYEVAYWKLFHAVADLVPGQASPAARASAREVVLADDVRDPAAELADRWPWCPRPILTPGT
jgi:hypothetical protein